MEGGGEKKRVDFVAYQIPEAQVKQHLHPMQSGDEGETETINDSLQEKETEDTAITRAFTMSKDEEDEVRRLYSEAVKPPFCSKCFAPLAKLPLFLQSLIYAVLGVCVFMVPAIIVFYTHEGRIRGKSGDALKREDELTERWSGYSIYVSISWAAWFMFRWFFRILPEVILRIASTSTNIAGTTKTRLTAGSKVEKITGYLRALAKNFAFIAWCVVNNAVYIVLLPIDWKQIEANKRTITEQTASNQTITTTLQGFDGDFLRGIGESTSSFRLFVSRFWLFMILSSIVWTFEKFWLQVFTVHFHKKAYKDRIERSDFAYSTLSHLYSVLRKTKKNAAEDDEEKQKIVEKIKSNVLGVGKHLFVGIGQIFGAAVGLDIYNSGGMKLSTSRDAIVLARKLFMGITGGNNDVFIASDLYPYYSSIEEAKKAFALFDPDNNGDVNRTEFRSAVLTICRERQALDKSLHSSSQAIDKLDSLLKVFVYIVILVLALAVLNVDTSKFMTGFISLWAGIVFAVGGTIKNLVESIIFLFLVHPYDVGDRVELKLEDKKDTFVVKQFGLITTVFIRRDGQEIYVANSVLATKAINNWRRSGDQNEDIIVNVSIGTSSARLRELHNHLLAFVARNPRDFHPRLLMIRSGIVDKSHMEVTFTLEHKGNWQDAIKKRMRTDKFMDALREGILRNGIQLPGDIDISLSDSSIEALTTTVRRTGFTHQDI